MKQSYQLERMGSLGGVGWFIMNDGITGLLDTVIRLFDCAPSNRASEEKNNQLL